MKGSEVIRLLNLLKQNPTAAGSSDPNVVTSLLKAAGVGNITQADRDEFDSLSSLMGNSGSSLLGNPNAPAGSFDSKYGGYTNAVNSIMKGDPKTQVINAALNAVGEVSHAAADTVSNNYNKLAQAILQGTRQRSSAQTEKWGKSGLERAGEMAATERQRRGENIAIWARALGNVVDKITGDHQRTEATRQMYALKPWERELGLSGQTNDAMRKSLGL